MNCSGCKLNIPTSQPVYCCIDQRFCSISCSKKNFCIIQHNDPSFENPHNWNDILNNNHYNNEKNYLLENKTEIGLTISIRRNKSKGDFRINIESVLEINDLMNTKKNKEFKKYINFLKLDKIIKDALLTNIICKYKLHIISILMYSLIIYGIYKIITIKQN